MTKLRRALNATSFTTKTAARQWAWNCLSAQQLARPPLPPHGRIPNFSGAGLAARRLFEQASWREASAIKVNPDTPQREVRRLALSHGIRVYVPTPRLAGGFHLLDPAAIDAADYQAAATLSTLARYSTLVSLDDLPQLDAIVTGCAAVTAAGKRCGKGAGYSDLEYALLLELGHRPVPVATTVHDVQVLEDFPADANDLPLSLICTPTRMLPISEPLPVPRGIDWSRLSETDIAQMSLLKDLQRHLKRYL